MPGIDSATVVLVVPDAKRAADFQALLASVYLECLRFRSGVEALAGLQARSWGCMLVHVAGLECPAPEFQRLLASRWIRLPTVYLTESTTVAETVAAFHAGAADFLEFPCNDQRLIDSVHRALDASRRAWRDRERREDCAHRFRGLTPRERDVMEPMVRGWPSRRIADALSVSEKTVEVYRARVIRKTGAGNLPGLMRMAIRAGLFEPGPRWHGRG